MSEAHPAPPHRRPGFAEKFASQGAGDGTASPPAGDDVPDDPPFLGSEGMTEEVATAAAAAAAAAKRRAPPPTKAQPSRKKKAAGVLGVDAIASGCQPDAS